MKSCDEFRNAVNVSLSDFMYQRFLILIQSKCISDNDTWYFFVSWYMYHWYSPTPQTGVKYFTCAPSLYAW